MTLPFKQSDIYLGLAEICGLLHIGDEALEIEYKVKDTTLGFLDSAIQSCRIPFQTVHSADLEKKWFSVKFELLFDRIPDLDTPFQLEGNSLTLSVKKRDFEKAKTFRSALMAEVLERKIDSRDEEEAHSKRRETAPERDRQPEEGRKPGGLENILRED